MTQRRVLVVGAGATGACASLRLRRALGKEVSIEVWEKARGPGGRMSTNRQELQDGCVRADMGAQYASLDTSSREAAEVADLLVEAGVCADAAPEGLAETPERRSGGGWRHLAGVGGGVNDALKKILEEAGADLKTERRLASLDPQEGGWWARPVKGGAGGWFDAVVLAIPGYGKGGDNLNSVRGKWEQCLSPDQSWELGTPEHDERWSYAFFLPARVAPRCDAFFGQDRVEKAIDDGVVHLLCYQSRKTARACGHEQQGPVAVVAHTTTAWSRRNQRQNGRSQSLLSEVARSVGRTLGLDEPLQEIMLASKTITWFQSQVTRAISAPEAACMALNGGGAPLVLAGDYFADSSFGGCLRSGFAAADAVAAALGGAQAPSRPKVSLVSSADASGGKARGKGKGKGKGGDGGDRRPADGWSDDKRRERGDGGPKGGGKRSKSGYSWQPYTGA